MSINPKKNVGSKILSFLGVIGCISCYVAMFPLTLVGIVGVMGVSTVGIVPGLQAYISSPFFNPILIASIVLLILGMIPYGRVAVSLSIASGVMIYISMNFYMQAWLFLFAFLLLALAQIWPKLTKLDQIKPKDLLIPALPFIIIILFLGVVTYISVSKQTEKSPPKSSTMMRMQK